jgi:hypothetical protein
MPGRKASEGLGVVGLGFGVGLQGVGLEGGFAPPPGCFPHLLGHLVVGGHPGGVAGPGSAMAGQEGRYGPLALRAHDLGDAPGHQVVGEAVAPWGLVQEAGPVGLRQGPGHLHQGEGRGPRQVLGAKIPLPQKRGHLQATLHLSPLEAQAIEDGLAHAGRQGQFPVVPGFLVVGGFPAPSRPHAQQPYLKEISEGFQNEQGVACRGLVEPPGKEAGGAAREPGHQLPHLRLAPGGKLHPASPSLPPPLLEPGRELGRDLLGAGGDEEPHRPPSLLPPFQALPQGADAPQVGVVQVL